MLSSVEQDFGNVVFLRLCYGQYVDPYCWSFSTRGRKNLTRLPRLTRMPHLRELARLE